MRRHRRQGRRVGAADGHPNRRKAVTRTARRSTTQRGTMPTAPDTSKPWPHFLIRYMLQNDESTFEDLIWSVGGSPPYGGVSYEEAKAIFELVENYRGPGTA